MDIRAYREEDIQQVYDVFYEAVMHGAQNEYTERQRIAWVEGVDLERWNRSFLSHTTLVAVVMDRVVGFSDLDYDLVDYLYVDPDFYRQGFARQLVNELMKEASEKKIPILKTYASKTARPFFEAMGFCVVEENHVIRDGVELINYYMQKEME